MKLALYVALHDNFARHQLNPKIMPAIASLIHDAAVFLSAFSFAHLVRALFSLSVMAGLVMFFRPLLTGIVRALVLTVRPRLAKDATRA